MFFDSWRCVDGQSLSSDIFRSTFGAFPFVSMVGETRESFNDDDDDEDGGDDDDDRGWDTFPEELGYAPLTK